MQSAEEYPGMSRYSLKVRDGSEINVAMLFSPFIKFVGLYWTMGEQCAMIDTDHPEKE
jgi:hypothetical protein